MTVEDEGIDMPEDSSADRVAAAGTPTTDHGGLEVLSREECDALLRETPIGRVSFISAGLPTILPVNYRFSAGVIVFLSTLGEKVTVGSRGAPAAFEIDGFDVATKTGWSVLARGHLERVYDEGEIAELSRLGLKPWAGGLPRDVWLRIRPDEITGRAIVKDDSEAG